MASLLDLFVRIGAEDQASDTVESASNSMANSMKKVGAAIGTYFAADKILDFGKACVSAAAEVSAETSAFEQIMGSYSAQASEKIQQIADAAGIVDSRLTPYMTSLTAKFKGLGYGIDEATDLASTGLTIAADAAAFWDKSLNDAMGSLNSFVNGNYEGGEAIGLFANETTLAAWAAENLSLEWENLTEKEKQFARLEFAKAMQNASGATGQAAKEASQYANVQANLTEKWRQFKAEIGEPILQNVVIPGMETLGSVIEFASGNLDELTIVATTLAGVLGAKLATGAVMSVVSSFQAAQVQLALYTMNAEGATLAQGVLNGQLTAGEIVVGVLTGKISAATAAQYAWNTAINANPIGVLVGVVGTLAITINKAKKAGESYSNKLKETDGTLSGTIAKYNQLSIELAGLEDIETELGYLEDADMRRKMALEQAVVSLEADILALTDAETAAAIASGELTVAEMEATETLQTAADEYAEAAKSILEDYYSTYNSIYEGLHSTGTVFTETTEKTKITWKEAMENMTANTQLLEGIDSNFAYISSAAEDAGIDISGFSEILADMSTADAAGLLESLKNELEEVGPGSEEAAKTLSDLATAISSYNSAGQSYSDALATTVADVEARIQEATDNYKAAVGDLDMGAEAVEAGQSTMDGLASGIAGGTPGVLSKIDSLASQMKSRLQTSFSNFTLNISANVTTNASASYIRGSAIGLDFVPYNGFPAILHRGEAVLTSPEADEWRKGRNADDTGGITINQYIQTPVETPAELAAATEAYFQQARWAVAL